MCTYVTENVSVSGSAKGAEGWSPITQATVYFDHPYHAPFEHTLNIDFADPAGPKATSVRSTAAAATAMPTAAGGATPAPARRVAVELSAASARALAHAILATLDSGEASVAGVASYS